MISKYFTIERKTKYDIFCKKYLPDENGKIDNIVITLHGFAGDKESSAIEALATKITLNKGLVISFDFPAHGNSNVDGKQLTIDNCLDDFESVLNYIQSTYMDTKINLFATSFGAYILLLDLIRNDKKYNSIVLRCPAICMNKIFLKSLLKESMEEYKKRGYTKLGFEREIILPYSFWKEINNIDLMKNYNINTKMLIIHGDKDDMAPIENSIEFKNKNSNVQLYIVEGADHRFKKEGELDKVINKTVEYIFSK